MLIFIIEYRDVEKQGARAAVTLKLWDIFLYVLLHPMAARCWDRRMRSYLMTPHPHGEKQATDKQKAPLQDKLCVSVAGLCYSS